MNDHAGPATVELDARNIEARHRHRSILEQLAQLEVGESLRLINDHDPIPLRYQLEAEFPDHYQWVRVEDGPERWTVEVTSKARVVDARPIIAAGGEPFEMIMQAAAAIQGSEVLVVHAPFDPTPLEGVLADHGFDHVAEQLSDNHWRVRFWST